MNGVKLTLALENRHEEHAPSLLPQVVVLEIPDHPDDLASLAQIKLLAVHDAPPERVPASEEDLCERFIYNGHPGRARNVAVGERAAGDKLHAHSNEIIGRNGVVARPGPGLRRRFVSLDRNRTGHFSGSEKADVRKTCRANTRQIPQALLDLRIEGRPLRPGDRVNLGIDKQYVRLVEPGVERVELQDTAKQQTGAADESKRQCHLCGDQDSAETLRSRSGTLVAGRQLERRADAHSRRAICRDQAEEQRSPAREQECEPEHASVRRGIEDHGAGPGGDHCDQERAAKARDHQPQRAPGNRKEKTLGQELPHEPGALRAQGQAHGKLAGSRCPSGEEQIREI